MSEGGDVTLIQDEDLLRRMWQQTEDFSRKKEIRAHMYRLREERLRNLYSPEPPLDAGKGCEFTSTQGHVKSFADQSFQSMKSKEVRDAGSPPKDFTYRGQELKELSNAGWNVESEDRTADDGHMRVKSVQANIQGRYDVDGGKGQFSAIDVQKEAVTDYQDENTSLKKNETTSHTAAHEQVVRKTDDGAQFSSKTSSSTSSSKFQQVSSTKHETVPYVSNDDYDSSRQISYDTNRSVEKLTNKQIIKSDNEQNLRTEFEHGELESRKVEYPDSNTKVIVETRRLPDGSIVTSTRREIKVPAVHSSHSEHHSQMEKSKSEIKSSSASTHTISDVKESSAKTTRENISNIRNNIVDSQRNRDSFDFNRNMQTDHSRKQKDDFSETTRHRIDQQHYETNKHTINKEDYDRQDTKTNLIDNKQRNEEIIERNQYENTVDNSKQTHIESDRNEICKSHHIDKIQHEAKNVELKEFNDNERVHVIRRDMKVNENEEKRAKDEYQTTYQSEFSQKKVSMDWSPTHQAWASTLRADTPPTTRPSTRASSPGGRTFKSSTSSLRSSVSPDKTYKKPNSRSQSPNKVSRYSPTKSPERNQPHTALSNTTPETKYPNQVRQRPSVSPDKKLSETLQRPFASPNRKPNYESYFTGDNTPRNISPTRPNVKNTPTEQNSSLERPITSPYRTNVSRSPDSRSNKSRSISPMKPSYKDNYKSELSPSPERKPKHQHAHSPSRTSPEKTHTELIKTRSSVSPDKKPSYTRPTASIKPSETIDKPNTSPISHYETTEKETTARRISPSPERKLPCDSSFVSKITEHHNEFVGKKLSPSPERKPKHQPATSPSRTSPEKTHTEITKTRSSVSPDKKPGYMRPTESSIKPSETIGKPNTSPIRHYDRTEKETTARHISLSPERKPLCDSYISKITEHHNKFVDEEIESQTRNTKDSVIVDSETRKSPTRIYPSTDEKKPVETTQSIRPTLRTSSRSPSPSKGPVTFTKENNEFSVTDNKTEYDVFSKHTNQNKTIESTTDNSEKQSFIRGKSPTKFGTYTKKQYEEYDSLKNQSSTDVDTSVIEITKTKDETHDSKSKSIINKDYKEDKKSEKSSTFRRSSESPKKSFRESVSPQKSPTKGSKFKITTEFIATERMSEENKRSTSPKNRPRQLVTPSTSPTRKPKTAETAPSTGQSSPTTSVSGFIYFSSPRTEQITENEKLVSEIDKTEQTTSFISSEERNSTKIPSLSKIPCRSPSPDKRIHSTNDGAPRKSSLKKPSKENNLDSPVEKPPTSFRVSPPVETVEISEHKIVKKDRPDKSDGNTAKTKPPLERRETYEERCRKILGMMVDNTSDTKKNTASVTNVVKSETSSTSVSPCPSPEMKEITHTEDTISTNDMKTKYDVTDFISSEKESLRKTSPTKLDDIISKSINESKTKVLTEENTNKTLVGKTLLEKSIRKAPEKPSNIPTRLGQPKTTEEQKNLRSPSPSKKVKSLIDGNIELISSEREQEILDKVQKSLRKLSPNRKEKSPSREKSPSKTSTSLQDLEITKAETVDVYEITSDKKNTSTEKSVITNDSKHLKQSTSRNSSARNASPVKKPFSTTSKTEKCPESPTKPRSISPRKSYSDRPQSPQISKPTNFKNKEPITTRRLSSGSISTSKTEKIVSTDTRKVSNIIKQNSSTNKTTTTKTVTNKGSLITKDIKDTPITKKDSETKVTRTASDMSIKTKKTSPQRMRSKPEIQINDLSTTKTPKQNINTKKPTYKEPQKLTSKPKSATTLNSPNDEDDIIIDVEQAKSSRENSPDRICPTPINLLDDVSTPRLPDEVSEPDDEFRKRAHHTIHEAESIVDDIVEISEEDELFSKMSNVDRVTETDECLLSVTDKVSKFSKIDVITKGKDSAEIFKDNEIRVHSDFINKNLQSDECLMTVSEKVNKFAKGSPGTKDRSLQRRITDGYDTNTVYQDDYTKLSVNDKAHLFVETAENLKTQKTKSTHKIERPDLTNVDESLKSDDCLLSVSDKVHKFVKTAEQSITENQDMVNKEKNTTGRYVKEIKNNSEIFEENNTTDRRDSMQQDYQLGSFAKETESSHAKAKDYVSPNLKQTEKTSTTKITTLRSTDAVKKAKAHFENIASTTHKTKNETANRKTTKLTDIGVIKKSPITDSTIVLHPSLEDGSPNNTDVDSETDNTVGRPNQSEKKIEGNVRGSAPRNSTPEVQRTKTPQFPPTDFSNSTKPTVSRKAGPQVNESLKSTHHDITKPEDKIPGYQRPTKTSQLKEETKVVEETEISSRRGSGKFGVELRRTSIERSTVSSERRRSSVEHHQPCIEDIFDLDLLEQMLGKVVGYEQRRRIRAQMRVAKKKMEIESTVETTHTKTVRQSTLTRSPERRTNTKSPERPKSKARIVSPVRSQSKEPIKPILNGHSKHVDLKDEPEKKRQYSPERVVQKSTIQTKSPSRHASPDSKKTRATSPNKIAVKPKTNRFSEYATAYMKKVGINEADKLKLSENKTTKTTSLEVKELSQSEESKRMETKSVSTSKIITHRSSTKNTIELLNTNEKRSLSPEKKRSPERTQNSTERLQKRTPSPDFKRPTTDDSKQETTSKTVYGTEKNTQPKQIQEEKPSWVTNRNLKKVTTETRTFSSKKLEVEKPKYRPKSPSKAINKPTDVITSSYGPGPLDSDGRPLFGIRALRNGTSNYQVKGTVIRQEYHSRNGGEPEGTVSVTAYSTEPEQLQELLRTQGHRPPGRMHGLAAITTTKKFGGDSGTTLAQAHTKEEHASLEQFTHSDRRVASHREDRKTVRQSSVKSLTEKYIKSATETSKSERSAYPKAGLILRSANIKDNVSSESSVHAGLDRTDSEHSLASLEETVTSSTQQSQNKSFLDSTTKVTGVQDILTRMKNADIVIDEGDSSEDREARALLNKFLGATVLMAGMQSYVTESPAQGLISHQRQETVRSSNDGGQVKTTRTTTRTAHLDIDQCWDERVLKKLLQECTDYEQRRRLRARIRTLMAEQEACASAVTEALAAAGESPETAEGGDPREKEEVTTVTSSVRRNSSEKTVSTSSTTTKTSKVTENTSRTAPKQVSPFAKFRQLEKQNSTNSPNSAASPQSPGSGHSGQPLFKFTDPALQASANTIKERLLQWCRDKTRDYENVKLENFSTSWADGLAFCALIHHFLPDAFDYSKLTPERRRHNFTLAFKLADEKAGIYPLLDVDDMVSMRKPDWKCVFTYVQAIHRRFKDN